MTGEPAKRPFVTRLFALVGFGLSGYLAWILIHRFDFHGFQESVFKLSVPLSILAILVYFLGFLARASRCQIILGKNFSISILGFLRALFVGCCLNGFLPYRMGEVGRVVYLHSREKLNLAVAVANLAAERLLDVAALALLALGVAIPLVGSGWLMEKRGWLFLVLALSLSLSLLGAWGSRRFRATDQNITDDTTPISFLARLKEPLGRFARGLECLAQPISLAGAFILSLVAMGMESLSYFLLLYATNLPVPYPLALTLFVSVGFTTLLPAAPGNLGVLQFATILVLGKGGIPESDSLNFSLFLTLLLYLPAFAGLGILITEGWAPLRQAWTGVDPLPPSPPIQS